MGNGETTAATATKSNARQPLAKGTIPAIVAMGLAIFVIANDVTAMSVALPGIENDLNADIATVQWVVSAYALVFGVLIVTGGKFADMFGRRRILIVGAAFFAGFSLVGGLAPNAPVLLVARAMQGIGGALMWPATLGLLYSILPDDRADLAGGLVIGIAGVGNAAGPLIGGVLTQELSWRWILLLNLPITALTCVVTMKVVPKDAPTERSRIDGVGIATITLGLFALLIALTEGPDVGWTSPEALALFALSAVMLTTFVVRERRMGKDALITREVIANKGFRNACIGVMLMSAPFFGCLLYLPQFLQKILEYDPLKAGAGLLPLMAVFAAASFLEGAVVRRIGARAVVITGASCMTVGTFIIWALLRDHSGYLALVPGMVVLGVGIGLFYSSVTTAAVTALPPEQSSLAGGILYMFQIAGGAVGLGLSTAAFLIGSNQGVDDQVSKFHISFDSVQRSSVRGVLAGTDSAHDLLEKFSHGLGEQLTQVVRSGFVGGLRWALMLEVILAALGLWAATKVVPRKAARSA
jgi:EmrB/QacA subfamily drug resistance transporter